MKTFEQRKAEIFCRAKKQKEKEKKARARAVRSGLSAALCLCVAVTAVWFLPETGMDAPIADAASKGNADVTENVPGDLDGETSGLYYGSGSTDDNLVCSAEDAENPEYVPEMSEEKHADEVLPEMSEGDTFEESISDEEGESIEGVLPSVDILSESMGGRLVVARVEEVYEDYLYDELGRVLFVPCEALFGADDCVKLALPMSYEGKLQTGDTLIALLDPDSAYDVLLREDTLFVLGKTQELFAELSRLDGFLADMNDDEVVSFFCEYR